MKDKWSGLTTLATYINRVITNIGVMDNYPVKMSYLPKIIRSNNIGGDYSVINNHLVNCELLVIKEFSCLIPMPITRTWVIYPWPR